MTIARGLAEGGEILYQGLKLVTEPSDTLASDMGSDYHHPILIMLGGNICWLEIARDI